MGNIRTIDFSDFLFTNAREGERLIHPDHPDRWYDPSCMEVKQGELNLWCKANPTELVYWDGRVFHPYYGVGSAMSVKGDFSYGRYEFEAKLPFGKYMYPAIWLSGTHSWPPEIDILEGYNTKLRKRYLEWPGRFVGFLPSYKIETNVHYSDEESFHKHTGGEGASLLVLNCPSSTFNVYSLEWRKDSIKIFYNSVLVRQITDWNILNCFNKNPEMHVLMTMNLYKKTSKDNKFPDSRFIIKSFQYYPL